MPPIDIYSVVPPGVKLSTGFVKDEFVNPTNNTECIFTVPSGYYVMPLFWGGVYQTAAVAGTRVNKFTAQPPSPFFFNAPFQVTSARTMTINEVVVYLFSVDVGTSSATTGGFSQTEIPRMLWEPKTIIKLQCTGGGGGDLWQSPTMLRLAMFEFTQLDAEHHIDPSPITDFKLA